MAWGARSARLTVSMMPPAKPMLTASIRDVGRIQTARMPPSPVDSPAIMVSTNGVSSMVIPPA